MTHSASDADATRRPCVGGRGWRSAGLVLLAVGVAIRINNAIRYRTGNGFDAVENFEYIRLLMSSWALPAPDAAWATSHPPLFYYMSAALWHVLAWLGIGDTIVVAIPLLVSIAGMIAIGAAVVWVRKRSKSDIERAVIAGALLLFMPVQIYMAAMVSEELLVTMWISLALLAALPLLDGNPAADAEKGWGLGWAALIGLLGGLAMLTKLTGGLVLAAIAGTWLIGALRSRSGHFAVARCAVMGVVALAVGGWFYLHNLWAFGYLYPQDLAVHAKMFELPPGSRGPLDYLRVPFATFLDPQLVNSDLIRSVWGSTYDTLWFDGHRHFLANSVAVSRMGTIITLLALLPTLAFASGVVRGVRRAWAEPGGLDTLLLLLIGLLLFGYVFFTWGNPWYVTVKGSYLLGLSLPFAVYASESLSRWTRPGGMQAIVIYALLGLLMLAVSVTFTIGPVFMKLDGPGLPWRSLGG